MGMECWSVNRNGRTKDWSVGSEMDKSEFKDSQSTDGSEAGRETLEGLAWFSHFDVTRTSSSSTVSPLKVVHKDEIRPEDQQRAGGPASISQSNKPAKKVHPLYVNTAEPRTLSPTTTAGSSSGAAPKGRTTTTSHKVQVYSSLQLAELENYQSYSELKQK